MRAQNEGVSIPHPRTGGPHSSKPISFSFSFGCHRTCAGLGAFHCPPPSLSLSTVKPFSPHCPHLLQQLLGAEGKAAEAIWDLGAASAEDVFPPLSARPRATQLLPNILALSAPLFPLHHLDVERNEGHQAVVLNHLHQLRIEAAVVSEEGVRS